MGLFLNNKNGTFHFRKPLLLNTFGAAVAYKRRLTTCAGAAVAYKCFIPIDSLYESVCLALPLCVCVCSQALVLEYMRHKSARGLRIFAVLIHFVIMQSDNTVAGPSRPKRGRFHKYTDEELLEMLENRDVESDIELGELDDGWPSLESGSDSEQDRENEDFVINNSNLSEGR